MGTRRGHGEGTIVHRPDGRWMAQIDLGYIEGKRKRKTVYGKTRKDVSEKLTQLLAQHQKGYNVAPERQTVAEFLQQWLTDIVGQRCRPTTQEMYRQSVLRISKHLGHVQLGKLTAQHVQTMLQQLAKEGYAAATVDRARDVLINALNQAVEWESVPRNVAALTSPPKVEAYQARVLTRAEAQRFLSAAKCDRLEALWRIGLGLGLRRGEVLGLHWDYVDLDRGSLRIAGNLQRIDGKLVVVRPKTKESQRTLSLPPSLVTALHTHRARQLQEQLLAGSRWKEHGLVFCTRYGTPISPRNLLRSLDTLLARAGLPHMRFHDLRHSCASFLAAQNVHPRMAQQILGHSDVRTTLAIYTHLADDTQRDILASMGRFFDVEDAG